LQSVLHHITDYPGACYIEETGNAYQIGESWQPEGVCWQQTCHDFEQGRRTKTFLVSFNTCGLVYAEPPCVLVEDASARYPDCCPRYVCPTPTEESENETRENEIPDYNDAVAPSDYDVTMDKQDYYQDKFPLLEFYRYKYGIKI